MMFEKIYLLNTHTDTWRAVWNTWSKKTGKSIPQQRCCMPKKMVVILRRDETEDEEGWPRMNRDDVTDIMRPGELKWKWLCIRVRTIVWKSDSPIVDSIGQNNQPMRYRSDSFRRSLTRDNRRSMNNFNRKSINHAYKHMILSVTHSTQSICTKFTSNQYNPGWGDRLPTICQRITVRRQHNRTIWKLSVWNNRPERLSSDSPTIGRYDSMMGLSS